MTFRGQERVDRAETGKVDRSISRDAVIVTRGLTKHYGNVVALADLDLEVSAGTVFGYLGPNGAGKTTTIRTLVGLLRPTAGSATILGLDVVARRGEMQARIGYLPGEFVAYPRLTAREYLVYVARLREVDNWGMLHDLAERLELPLDRRVGELSHGNRQKVGLVQAFLHNPEVLILDEPTSGLDPLVQREFLAMVREARDRGQTVFLSSHVLAEVEAVADEVAILRAGRLVAVEDLADLKEKATYRLELELTEPIARERLSVVPGVRDVEVDGLGVLVTVEGSTAGLIRALSPLGVDRIHTHEADLEEIFLRHYRREES